MRQLLLLRHAKSAWDDPRLSDHDRPLNARGREAAAAMARAMRELGLAPDLVLVSSAVRTRQTLAAHEPWEAAPLVETMERLYLADARTLFSVLHATAETVRSVLVIGHNPGLHEFAMALTGAQAMSRNDPVTRRLADGYPTGTLTEFVIAGPWWSLEEAGGRLVRMLAPRDLPEFAG